jgi:hypothetical protein
LENENRIHNTKNGLIANYEIPILMTEEELNGFKELAESIDKITEYAVLIY